MTVDLDTRLADDVAHCFHIAFGVDEVTMPQPEDGAVGKQLIQVGVGVSGR